MKTRKSWPSSSVCNWWLIGLDEPGRTAQRHGGGDAPDGRRSATLPVIRRDEENPLDTQAVNEKARGLMAPVLGAERAEAIISV